MSTIDYIVDILLILVIFYQVRPRKLTAASAVLPLLVIVYAAQHYLHGFSLGGNDLPLIVALTLVGAALGTWSAVATRVWPDDRTVFAQVGIAAAASWIGGMGFRFAFAVYASTDAGGEAIARFSIHHSITSGQAWTTALVAMAFAEVLARVVLMQRRRHLASAAGIATWQTPAHA